MTDYATISPTQAKELLSSAEAISKQTHNSMRWPYTIFIFALGLVTSIGSFAMATTTGEAFGLSYLGTIAATFAALMFFLITTKGKLAFSWSRRWSIYVGSWTVAYIGAITVVSFAHGSVLWAGITSGIVLAVTTTCALIEVRR